MMKSLMAAAGAMAGGAVLLASPGAQAQEQFARSGQFAVSAERLTGVVFASESQEANGTTYTTKVTSVNLLLNATSGFTSNYSFSRVGLDYFATDGLSLGASLGLFSASASVETEAGGQSQESDAGGGTGWLLAPRIGYAYMFRESVGIWPRGGITYLTVSSDSGDGSADSSASRLALSLEVPLILAPVPHVAFAVGPTLDLGLSGSDETTSGGVTVEQDVTATEFGLQAGIVVWF
jgi:hypothetical protein